MKIISDNDSETSRARATAVAKVSARRAEHARRESGVGESSVCLGRQAAPSGQRDRCAAEPAESQPAPRRLARQRRGIQWTQPLSAGSRRSPVSCPLTRLETSRAASPAVPPLRSPDSPVSAVNTFTKPLTKTLHRRGRLEEFGSPQ